MIQGGEHAQYVYFEGGVNDMHNGVVFSSTPYNNCLATLNSMGATTIVEEVYPVTSGYADPVTNNQAVGAVNIQAWNAALDPWALGNSLKVLPEYTTFASPATFLNILFDGGDGLHLDHAGVFKRAQVYAAAITGGGSTAASRFMTLGVGGWRRFWQNWQN